MYNYAIQTAQYINPSMTWVFIRLGYRTKLLLVNLFFFFLSETFDRRFVEHFERVSIFNSGASWANILKLVFK